MQINIKEEMASGRKITDLYGIVSNAGESGRENVGNVGNVGNTGVRTAEPGAEFLQNIRTKYRTPRSESYKNGGYRQGESEETTMGIAAKSARTSESLQCKTELIGDSIEKLNEILDDDIYSRMETMGLAPEEDSPEVIVTVAERIMIELAAHCDDYAQNMRDAGRKINSEKIDRVLGTGAQIREAAAGNDIISNADTNDAGTDKVVNSDKTGIGFEDKAGTGAGDDTPLSDNAKEYIIRNNLKPTEENIYKAVYSSKNTYPKESMPAGWWEELEPQAKKVIEQSGMEAAEGMLDNSRWLVERNLPVTGDNLKLLDKLNHYEGGISDGMEDIERAKDAVDTLKKVSSDELRYMAVNNNELTIEGLRKAAEYFKNHKLAENRTGHAYADVPANRIPERMSDRPAGIAADRTAERTDLYVKIIMEARLVMTTQSAYAMIRMGINIETEEISGLLDKITENEKAYYGKICKNRGVELTYEEQSVYINAMNVIAYVRTSSAVAIDKGTGEVYEGRAVANIAAFSSIAASYESASTEVRRDLGDSIKKAFSSTDSLLSGLGMESTESNRRAVRILSYCGIDVTEQSIEGVKEIRRNLDDLLAGLTPEITARLVKNRINPLDTDIKTLNTYLSGLRTELENGDESRTIKEAKKFSEFLYRADKEGRYTPEERDCLVGIYRLLNSINADDGKIIGELYRGGRKVNLRNMLKVARTGVGFGGSTGKGGKINVKLDEKFGLAEEVIRPDDIEYKIESLMNNAPDADTIIESKTDYMKNVMKNVFEKVSAAGADKILNDANAGDLQPEQLDDIMRQNPDSDVYGEYEHMRMEAAARVSEESMRYLLGAGIGANVGNLLAYEYLMSAGNIYRDLTGFGKKGINSAKAGIDRAMSDETIDGNEWKELISNGLNDISEEIDEALRELVHEASYDGSKLAAGTRRSINAEDIRLLTEAGKNVSLMKMLADRNEFFIPVRTETEEITVRLRLKEGGENSRIRISMHTEAFGDIHADIRVSARREEYGISGILVLQNAKLRDLWTQGRPDGEADISIDGAKTDIRVICAESYGDTDADIYEPVENAALYDISRKLIRYICAKADAVR